MDLYAADEAVFLDIQRIKETQRINVEFARPEHFPRRSPVPPPATFSSKPWAASASSTTIHTRRCSRKWRAASGVTWRTPGCFIDTGLVDAPRFRALVIAIPPDAWLLLDIIPIPMTERRLAGSGHERQVVSLGQLEQLAQIPVRLAAVGLGGIDQAVQGRARSRTAPTAGEQSVLAPHKKRPDRLLAGVVVWGKAARVPDQRISFGHWSEANAPPLPRAEPGST